MLGKEPVQYQDPSLQESAFRSSSLFPHQALIQQFQSYTPMSDIIDIKKLTSSSRLKLKKYRTAAYYGQFANGKRHGRGIILYNSGRRYEGEWQSDLKHGRGYEVFENGCTFTGYYVNGKPEGVGRYQWPNGEFYEGQWVCGLRHGSGVWNGAKGDNYVGEWKLNKADGTGVHLWINGDRYEGQFRQGLKHGQGVQKFTNGDLYKGSFSSGKPHGYGEYFWSDGSFYKGHFRCGFRDGSGIWKKNSLPESDRYEGEYIKDKKHGYGIYLWSTGNVYKGNYENDVRDGYGEMYWTDGSYYRGQWRRGKQDGQGSIWTTDYGRRKGRFRDNVMVEVYEEVAEPMQDEPLFKKTPQKKRSKTKKYLSTQLSKEAGKGPMQDKNTNKPYILIKEFQKQPVKLKQLTHSSANRETKSIQKKEVSTKRGMSRPTTRHRAVTIRSQKGQVGGKEGRMGKLLHSGARINELDNRFWAGSIRKNHQSDRINHSNLRSYQRSLNLSQK